MKYKEANALNDVASFHKTFGAPIRNKPCIPNKNRCNLRIQLLQEELDEFKEAINQKDIVEIADALADIQYVLSGAILEFGMAEKFKNLFDEVQRSNMSKACLNMNEANETQKKYLEKDGTESIVEQRDGKYIVYRKKDKKVLKSINYSPAHLAEIIY